MRVEGHKTSSGLWKLATALRRPRLTVAYLQRKATLAKLTRSPRALVDSFYDELRSDPFAREIERNLAAYKTLALGFAGCAPELYVLIRLMRPAKIVETGVANGVSSALILMALRRNQHGALFSVSLDAQSDPFIPQGKEPGWLVPDDLRNRWNLTVGSSRTSLPRLMNSIAPIDMFFHDSDHSYDNMYSEFEVSWPQIKPGGYLVADDIWGNKAFADFCSKHRERFSPLRNAGVLRKTV